MPYVRIRRKPKRHYFTAVWLSTASLLFVASAAFYAKGGQGAPPKPLPPSVPGLELPKPGELPPGSAFTDPREQLPMPRPSAGRGRSTPPDLLPPAIVRPARPDLAERSPPIDGGIIQATYRELSGRKDLVFVDRDRGAFAKPIGTLNWDIASKKFVNGGLEPQFRTYCCEPFVSVTPGKTYQFRFDPIDRPEFFNQPNDEFGQAMTVQRVKYVRELYGKYYDESVSPKENAAAAFQAALWELVAESPVGVDQAPEFSLYRGTFRSTYSAPEAAPAYVMLGEEYLKALTGDDRAFFENPKFEQYELVRLTGVPGDDDSIPQSQIAIRQRTDGFGLGGTGGGDGQGGGNTGSPIVLASAMGRSGGAPLNSALNNGGIGAGGFPAFGGAGGGGSGGGTDSTGGTTGGTTDKGNTTGTGGTGGTGTGNPGGSGGTGGGTGGTGGGPDADPNPVPAPPALLLGLAGLGVLGGGAWLRKKK
jgi:hypothetical protein